VLSALAIGLSACGGNATLTPPPTRVATQTPWIIQIPVTVTPEPPTATRLPTITVAAPTRAPTKPPVAAKPTTAPTKPPAAPPPPTATTAPVCNLGTVSLIFPENGTTRLKGAAFEMKWQTPLAGETDPQVGYKIEMESRRGSQFVNGALVYISHNKYIQDGKFIFERRKVADLAQNDNASVTWKVTIVKATGGFDDLQQTANGTVITCGPPSSPSVIQLVWE